MEQRERVDLLPAQLVVVGGGYVGLEFVSMFTHFGSEVIGLDRGERPLKHENEDVAATAVQIMEGEGVTFILGASLTRSPEDRATVPYTMFLTPPLARVGMSVAQARDWAHRNGRTLKTASK